MNTIAKLALFCLPGGCILAVAAHFWPERFCLHRRELPDRNDFGTPVLRCDQCHRVRPNILANLEPRYRRTQQGGVISRQMVETGIERELRFRAAEAAAVDGAIDRLERQERHERAKVAVMRRFR